VSRVSILCRLFEEIRGIRLKGTVKSDRAEIR
jgi:hypothetical protein